MVFLLQIALVGAVVPAFAQTEDIRTNARIRFGPVYATPTVAVEEFGIDTNVFNDASQRQDFTFTVAPHVDAWVPFGRRALITTGFTPELVYFHTFSNQRSINPNLVVRGDVFFNRLRLFVEPSYINTRRRMNLDLDVRANRVTNGLRGGVELRVSPKVSVELSGSRSATAFDADEVFNGTRLQEILNRTTTTGSLTVRHELTPLTTLSLQTDVQAQRFEFFAPRDADSVAVLPGVEFKPRALISGTATIGVRAFRPLRGELPSFTGLVTSTMLRYTLFGATQIRFTADRDLSYSAAVDYPYFVDTGFGLSARHRLNRRLDVTVGATRNRYAYRSFVESVDEGAAERRDVTRTLSGSLGFLVGTEARLGFGVAYRERDSTTIAIRRYHDVRIISTLDYGF